MITALSRDLLICTNIMVSERAPAADLTEPTLSNFNSAAVSPSRVSEPTTR